MKKTLLLETVLDNNMIVLIDEDFGLLESFVWQGNKDEVIKVLPEIEKLLQKYQCTWFDLGRILVTNGVGNFSATRIGVTIANIMAMAVNAELYQYCVYEKVTSDGYEIPSESADMPVIEWDKRYESEPTVLVNLMRDKLVAGWKSVELVTPVYKSAPMISKSKKQIFKS